MSIRALVVDDQPMIRAGISAILAAQPDITIAGEAADGAEGVRLARRLTPDIVLMDVRMPVMNGLDAARELLAPGPVTPPKVLMLTTFDIDDYVYDALRAGASGFLLKDVPPDDLVAAVRTVAAGEALLDPRVTRRLIENFVSAQPAPPASTARVDQLTDREREVFVLMARGYSNTEIAAELFIAEQTTKTHVSRILAKLQLRDRVHAVVLGYETGLVTPGSNPV
ncbi:DNA-binding NarL/FixJ family response regulator [Diaminobutyricimonas aerilata]|uniref:DNA-binding NarL/FixJ family response regulator n=1 Tax=Diaminobutyricimonas aerilata TaxID=1162967 RepID=A0A2M9CMG0_9MICO|nr:response regulator transcription factor [Diaminobutyricimonas aerilata]PJJ73091.1 DNA-binding NarL/FixJ family response regulator [Diaminobutyricimonas aerilata]